MPDSYILSLLTTLCINPKMVKVDVLICIIDSMFIGASHRCNEYCEEEDKKKFEKYHADHRHSIFEAKAFTEENKDFMRKSKRAWNYFSIRLESFFKKIKNEIEFIQNEAFERLEYEEVKTAISTNDKHLTKITTDIMQERYRNLSCQEINEFIELRKKQQHSSLNIDKEEFQFASDIVQQLKDSFKEISLDFKQRSHHLTREAEEERATRKVSEETPVKTTDLRKQREQKVYKKEEDSGSQASKSTRNKQYRGNNFKKRNREEDSTRNRREEREFVPFVPFKTGGSYEEGPCPVLKIKELSEACKAFSIELKLVNFIKILNNKEIWRVSDDTGQIKLMIPSHKMLKEGAKVFLKNCYIRDFNRSMQIHTKTVTKISSQGFKEEELKYQSSYRPNKYDRSEQQSIKGKGLTKIDQIEPGLQRTKFIAKVLKVQVRNNDIYRCALGDQTGVVSGEFKGFESLLKQGSVLYFRGVQAEVDSEGHLYLTGKKILMEPAYNEITTVKESNNISAREYEQVSVTDK